VTIHYDPMLAKLSVWAADRPRALDRIGRALAELRIEGIRTTVPLYRALLADPDFRAGRIDTTFIERFLAKNGKKPVV
jgi:acetyl/propionyl-CoA carboxylase alpha subunit